MNKKLLLVNKAFYPKLGGIETVVHQYALFAKESGFEVTVLCVNPDFSLFTRVDTVDSLKIVRCSGLGTFFSMPVSVSFFYHLWRESRKADVVHGHYPFPLFDVGSWLIPLAKPVLLTWHSEILRQKFFKKLIHPFTSRLLSRSMITVTSPPLKAESELLSKCDEESVTVLPLSVSPSAYAVDIDAQCGVKDYRGRMLPDEFALFLGRFCYYKGVMFLLETIRDYGYLRDHCFVLAGEGELLGQAIEFVEACNLENVFILGRFVSEGEKKYLLNASHFLLFPSVLETEAFGIVQLEAMACSKPVINTALKSGVPWVSIDDETGITVSINDKRALAKAIARIFSDGTLYQELSRKARIRVQDNFSDEVISSRYVKILHSLGTEGSNLQQSPPY